MRMDTLIIRAPGEKTTESVLFLLFRNQAETVLGNLGKAGKCPQIYF